MKKNDFIEIEYTLKIKDTSKVVDTTSEKIAKENDIFNPQEKYTPKIICIGQEQILPSLEKELEGKELNKEYTIILPPEEAFGKKNPKLLQLVSMSHFKSQNINPYPGLHINLDNAMGIVRTVSPGRVIVDFNHPLSGRTIEYKVKILRKITDTKEQVTSILDSYHQHNLKLKIENSELTIKKEIDKEIQKKILELVPIIKKINVVKE
tara:strand:+ start:523 stop:1146 length:624 start_codon:yes stop_codon:yes gene_type:complete